MTVILRIISISTAVILAFSLCGCMSVDDGVYESGDRGEITTAPEGTSSEQSVSDTPHSKAGEPSMDIVTLPETMTETPAPSDTDKDSEEDHSESVSDVSDMIEPLTTTIQRDYSALDTESHGYGQGVRFDALNRPMGAVEFNDGYSKYNAVAINDTDEKVICLTFDQGY